MKIALIGNMNNNNFAIMRYFRDLGFDAHLLLYADDGRDTNSHFTPEADTWDIHEWSSFIHRLSFANGPHSIVGRVEATKFYGLPIAIALSFIRRLSGNDIGWRAPELSLLERELGGYDVYVGAGITPAIFQRIGRRLDMFYPYSTGIEYYGAPEFQDRLNSKNIFIKSASQIVKELQSKGIQNASICMNAEMGVTYDAFTTLGVEARPLAIPMVYFNSRRFSCKDEVNYLSDLIDINDDSEIRILHSARLFWIKPKNYPSSTWRVENKNSDWFFVAFSKFVKLRPASKAKLIVVEYGPDVQETKQLISGLGLSDYVVWVPIMPRKHLLWLHQFISASVGEFYTTHRTLWGGSGWEALATGTPLIQGFNFKASEFQQVFGYPPPPLFPVSNESDILKHLLSIADDRDTVRLMGKQSQQWFQTYNGAGLAKKWLELLMECNGNEEIPLSTCEDTNK